MPFRNPQQPRPNQTFALLSGLGAAVVGGITWSTHHLLVAGAPGAVPDSGWPGVLCLLLPVADDLTLHVASYAFLLAIGAGLASSVRALVRQQQQTHALLKACLARRTRHDRTAQAVARRVGLGGRLDVVDLPTPVAFCYGYLRPRVIVSRGLVATLPRQQLAALLLHEREHVRQRDPLKVALGKLLAAGVFFVPALSALYRHYLVEKELAADSAVIRAQGSATSLAAALVVFLERGPAPPPAFSAGADEALEARLDSLLGGPIRFRPRIGRIPLLGSATTIALALLPLLLVTPLHEHLVQVSGELAAGCHYVL
ncbi:MAG: M56 family metallopeptidase [Chloroflexi bacterium]|nr:M56 family metallopeptidase [Chloroflexota bacterium]